MNFKVKCHIYPYAVYFIHNPTLQQSKEEFEKVFLKTTKLNMDMSKYGALLFFLIQKIIFNLL